MLKINPFRQKYGYCGPASLKMVLDYFGVKKSEKELAHLSNCSSEQGVELKKLLETAQKLGFNGFIKDNAAFEDIRKYIKDESIPVIVDWFLIDDGHYSVVIDIDNENIYLQDPGLGHIQALRLEKFKRVWFDFPGDFLKVKEDVIIRRMLVIYR